MNSLIDAHGLTYKKGDKLIIEDVCLTIEPGKITTIIGPNGAGKTTLTKILLGVIKPSSGYIVRTENLKVGYVPQRIKLPSTLPISVADFVKLAYSGDVRNLSDANMLIDIEPLLSKQLTSLSGGELQRVLFFQALLGQPNLLVLDEPDQGIDVIGQATLYQKIDKARRKLNCAVVLVSHDLHIVMANSDEVICLNKHVCCSGHPSQIKSDAEFTKLFGSYVQPDTKKKVLQELAPYRHYHDHTHGEDYEH